MDSVMKGLMGAMPRRIFGLKPPLSVSDVSRISSRGTNTILPFLLHPPFTSLHFFLSPFFISRPFPPFPFPGFEVIVGRVATENVVVELLKKKCLPVLLYGLEVCPLSSSRLKSLNYAAVSSFKKIFNVSSTKTAKECMFMFGC